MKIKYDNALTELYESLEPIEEKDRLDEGIWTNIKYGLSKLGRYKAGGKIFGKGKVTDEAEAALDKVESKLTDAAKAEVKKVKATIDEFAPKWPNNKEPTDFLDGIIGVSAFYDSLVEGTKKTGPTMGKDGKLLKDAEKGYMPVDAANSIIKYLRELIKYYLDYKLDGIYTTTEEKESFGNILTEEEVLILEKNWFQKGVSAVGKGLGAIGRAKDRFMDKSFGDKKGGVNKSLAAHGDAGKKAAEKFKKTSGSKEFKTSRMGKEGLESNTLPMVLNLIGTSLGGLSWLTTTDWFKSLFDETTTTTSTEETTELIKKSTEETLGAINPGEGMTQILSRVYEGVNLSPQSSPEEFLGAIAKVGGGSVEKGIELISADKGIFMNSSAAKATLQAIASDPHAHGDTLGEVFKGTWAGTGQMAGDTLTTVQGGSLTGIFISVVTKAVIKTVVKTGIKTGAGYLLATKLGALLGPIGLGLILTGVTVKIMREKGQRQSRAKTLNDLLQSLQEIEPSEGNKPIIKPGPKPTPDPVPPDFLKGNRNMQLAHLSKLFLPTGEDLWSKLGLKDGTKIPSGFLDAALAQGGGKRNLDSEKYLDAYYDHLVKKGSFTTQIDKDEWINTILKEPDHLALVRWVRNTRKGIAGFLNALRKAFPKIFVMDEYTTDSGVDMMTPAAQRMKATPSKPGKPGEAMGTAGPVNASIDKKDNLLLEVGLGKVAGAAGFKGDLFMKNLPEFMSMLSAMYYSAKGTPLEYNKEAVMKECEKFGCKSSSGKTYEKTKSGDYHFQGEKGYRGKTEKTEGILHKSELTEELKRIKILMQ